MISPYHLFYYQNFRDINEFNQDENNKYDLFISAYTYEEIVLKTFENIQASNKLWLLLPEYDIDKNTLSGEYFEHEIIALQERESEYIIKLFNEKLIGREEASICIDVTGFMKPYMIFLLLLLKEKKFKKIDMIYTEPQSYENNSNTEFSEKEASISVRNITTFGDYYQSSNSDDLYIINVGYDSSLVNKVLTDIKVKEKKALVGFPSLQPIMYQENIINLEKSNAALNIGPNDELLYAPANNPFITAYVISKYIKKYRKNNFNINNIYLSPLATKAQTIGMALFYIFEKDKYAEDDISIHIRYPFTLSYSSKAGVGYFRINKYEIDFELFDNIK